MGRQTSRHSTPPHLADLTTRSGLDIPTLTLRREGREGGRGIIIIQLIRGMKSQSLFLLFCVEREARHHIQVTVGEGPLTQMMTSDDGEIRGENNLGQISLSQLKWLQSSLQSINCLNAGLRLRTVDDDL